MIDFINFFIFRFSFFRRFFSDRELERKMPTCVASSRTVEVLSWESESLLGVNSVVAVLGFSSLARSLFPSPCYIY